MKSKFYYKLSVRTMNAQINYINCVIEEDMPNKSI